ncbi:MAG: tetratricopeptide repeat protein [Pyrinomonadaceae bacterium]
MSDHFISLDRAENDLLDCAAFLAERIKSSDGHAEAMNTIVPMYLAKGDVDLAAELANAVDDPFSRDKLLIKVAVKCAEIDDEEYGLQLADAIEDHGLQSQAFERIGLVLAGKGKAEKAGEVADLMGHADFVYAGIAVNKASLGNDAGAEEIVEDIEFPSARVAALQQIGSAHIDAGKTDKGVAYLIEAVETAEEIEHDEEKIRVLCDIGNVFLDAKAFDKAIETFDRAKSLAELLENTHRETFLVNCTIGFLHAGSTELADRTLDLVHDKTQMASAVLGFARDHWAKEEKEEAIDALEEAYAIVKSQREIETRDSRSRNALITTIAAQFAGFGKSERGVEIALENTDIEQQMSALAQISQILTVQKEDALARETVNLIEEDANRMFALVSMADGKRKAEDDAGAVAVLDEAATLSETVHQLSARSEVLNEIADRYASLSEPEKARSTSIENLSIISQIRDESSQAVALANLAAVYAAAAIEPQGDEQEFIAKFARAKEW